MTRLTRLAGPALMAIALTLGPRIGLAETALVLQETVAVEDLKKSKRTTPGLYITAAEAGRVLGEHPNVALVDVRSPSETMLIGYPTLAAANVPVKLVDPDLAFDAEKDAYKMVDNQNFLKEMRLFLDSSEAEGVDTLLIMCRSGSRSAVAVERLVESGFGVALYNVVDGFEGDKNADGVRAVNGWRNAGLPWTYKVTEDYWPRAD